MTNVQYCTRRTYVVAYTQSHNVRCCVRCVSLLCTLVTYLTLQTVIPIEVNYQPSSCW